MKYLYTIAQKQYDYIIGGAGLAGLTLAYKLKQAGLLNKCSLLLIDADIKEDNDRTWSFWAKDVKNITDFPVTQSWEFGIVKSTTFEQRQLLSPYKYFSIEGLPYYNFIKKELSNAKNIDWLVSEVISIDGLNQSIRTKAGKVGYKSYYFKNHFSSNDFKELTKKSPNQFIWQHFLGKTVRFEQKVFDSKAITYMDFNVAQPERGLAFIYILPSDNNTALVEYTLFSAKLLDKKTYEDHLHEYLSSTYVQQPYEVLGEEYNKIPMTTLLGEKARYNCITIGTLAGTVKASTGYSYVRNQEHTEAIVAALKSGKTPQTYQASSRHHFYDKVLIEVLSSGLEQGKEVFEALYLRNSLPSLLKFLNEETNLWEELKLMNTVPKISFMRAAMRQLF